MKNLTRYPGWLLNRPVTGTIALPLLLTGWLLLSGMARSYASPHMSGEKPVPAPTVVSFTQHPQTQTLCEGSNTSFSVVASGTGTLTYRWQVSTNGGGSWNDLSDNSTYTQTATASLLVSSVTYAMNSYRYRCQVTDNSGTYPSNTAILTVNPAPVVRTGNGAAAICANGGGSISAQFFAGLSYQWQASTDNGGTWNDLTNTSPYSNVTTDMLIISNATSLNGNLYRYRATNTTTGCQATGGHDTLHVLQPVIFSQPVNAAICTGNDAAFTVTAASPVNLTYQWYRQTSPTNTALTEILPYSGTATGTLNIADATTSMNGYRYLVSVTDTLGCVTNSNLVTLNVYAPLAISVQPRDTFTCANTTIVLRVSLSSGSQPMTYQWQTDNGTGGAVWSAASAPVSSSATTGVLSLTNVPLSMNGYRYRVSITGTCGAIMSNEMILRVLSDGTWRGTTNTNWHTATNWCGGIPTSTTDVLIPEWAPRMPEISDATDTAYSRSLHIEGNARLTISGGTTAMSGPFNIEGTVAYTANADQQVLPADHGSLEIGGSGNKYMNGNTGISHDLVLGGSAKLITNAWILIMKAGSNPVSGATFNGPVTSWIVTGNGNSGMGNTGTGGLLIEQVGVAEGNVLYPVGATTAAYNPLELSNTGAMDDFTVAVNDQVIPGGVLQSGINRTWLVTEANPGGSDVTLSLRWAGPEEETLFDRTQAGVIRSNGVAVVQAGPTSAATGPDPYAANAPAFTVLTQFSVASTILILPVKLSGFTAYAVNENTAHLNWKTDGREEHGTFTIQKSAGGTVFTDIGTVGQEVGKKIYDFTDYRLGAGISQYRLKITLPGQPEEYTHTLQVNNQAAGSSVALRPSVTSNKETSLYLLLAQKDNLSITLVDVMGRVQFTKKVRLEKGEHYLPLDIRRLSGGIYYVVVTGKNTGNHSVRLLKQ